MIGTSILLSDAISTTGPPVKWVIQCCFVFGRSKGPETSSSCRDWILERKGIYIYIHIGITSQIFTAKLLETMLYVACYEDNPVLCFRPG